MITVTLTRKSKIGRAVNGTITFPIGERSFTYPTIENADFIIPAGTYPLNRTWSPKFKKLLPIIEEVPEREGIRIHMGTKPEHSTGCVLVGAMAAANLDIMFNYIEKNTEDEKVQIEITDDYSA
ncbi:MAG: DUF5675 family protein [Bacteroidales bacterium]|nr:DUF5675 family protein [Bacteroidales bacterium]